MDIRAVLSAHRDPSARTSVEHAYLGKHFLFLDKIRKYIVDRNVYKTANKSAMIHHGQSSMIFYPRFKKIETTMRGVEVWKSLTKLG
ncbi:unnamed protein product [Porites lobata]|uniref:Uncharacterized protein n=1 Tax=Porites lobata TaxID=104759 RepID=A0ABN8NFY2_9CNID|nr:unnamed protein product [Porites lobata]